MQNYLYNHNVSFQLGSLSGQKIGKFENTPIFIHLAHQCPEKLFSGRCGETAKSFLVLRKTF